MINAVPIPDFLADYYQTGFDLKRHIQQFLQLDAETLELKFASAQQAIAELGHRDFDWQNATAFYRDQVAEAYLFDLGSWHLSSQDYIGTTLRLVADHAKGRVLDFGGGIGTHTLAIARCPAVEQVIYCDINPINRGFVDYRARQLGLDQKIQIQAELPDILDFDTGFDTIVSFDVLEHLPDPVQQLLTFHKRLKSDGKMILNWCFFKGFNQEFPFHLDDPAIVELFFRTLQTHFLEVFHPYPITARCYQLLQSNLI